MGGMMKRRVLFLIGFLALTLAAPLALPSRAEADAARPIADIMANPWDRLRPATCMPDRCFCEGVGVGVIRQPVNTWSNLGFVLVGVMVLAIVVHDFTLAPSAGNTNLMQKAWVYPVVYGVATILIGIGSMLYHSSLAFVWQTVDVTSIYLLASFMLLYNVSRLRHLRGGIFAGCYALLDVVLAYVAIRWPQSRRYIFLLLVCAVLVSEWCVHRERRPRMNMAYLWAGIASLAAACIAWTCDVTGIACSSGNWLQGHALWHILMAAMIGLVFLYFRSEHGGIGSLPMQGAGRV
jgi:hypothetical protein